VEIWEPDGTRVISQNIGIRVHGGTSRGSDMKSLKLIARTQYGENRLSYALFPDERSDKTDTLIEEYKRVILRNHGNDGKKAYLRNELAQRLSAQAGFPDTQECRPAAVYLNGEYYGFEWLEEAYDEVYFESHYGTSSEQGSWQSVTPHRGNAETDSEDETEQKAVEDIGIVYTYLYRDLRNDADFEELQAILDVDNFLQYCAIEIYLSNPDWPDNNCKAYRWYSDTGLYENSYADGKWRFLLYDLDIGMARTGSSAPGDATLGEVLGAVESNWDRQEPLLRAILQREDMQERFVEIMEDMMEGAFSYENACAQIEQIRQEMGDELDFYMHTLAEEEFSKSDTEYESAQEAYEAYRAVNEEEIEKVKEFFRLRPETMREELKKLREYLA
jgi:spore coat protein CotH